MFFSSNDMPYFMKNKDWYELKEEEGKRFYAPTDKAPLKAINSIEEFNSEHAGVDEDGHAWADF